MSQQANYEGKFGSSDFDSDSSEDSSVSSECPSWITWFVSSQKYSLLCEVENAYIEDQFNIYGLKSYVSDSCYQPALDNILDRNETWNTEPRAMEAAQLIYGMCHSRYIVTLSGLAKMVSKNAVQYLLCVVCDSCYCVHY